MYNPIGNGRKKDVQSVEFIEAKPPKHLRAIVHRFLELKTCSQLSDDYRFHALPDACTYVIFDQLDKGITGLSKLRATSEEFNLGKIFHFVNIRFLPGVWQGRSEHVASGIVNARYSGNLPLVDINHKLSGLSFEDKQSVLSQLVEKLIDKQYVIANSVTETIFQNIDDIHTVSDMATFVDLSPRQLQRRLKQSTGFSPHDFLKVLRLQQTLGSKDISSYADQAHFIHSFRKATGYTPSKYARKFDV